eukprot:GHVH01004568.1.p1 GENE.GHVH01004568.1~~GHVH01004568.1.p1  ORF type:complete len:884 (+),score=62.28 GHVH01004568.1:102-2654(+)
MSTNSMEDGTLRVVRLEVTDKRGKEIFSSHDVALSAHPGELTAIIGESGGGKSLIIESILGTINPCLRVKGSLILNGSVVDLSRPKSVAHAWGSSRSIIVSFNRKCFPDYFRVSEIVCMSTASASRKSLLLTFVTLWNFVTLNDPQYKNYTITNDPITQKLIKNLNDRESKLVSALICLMTPLLCRNSTLRTIFLDEPTSALPSHWCTNLLQLSQFIAHFSRWNIVMVLHQPTYDQALCIDNLYIVEKKRLVTGGSFLKQLQSTSHSQEASEDSNRTNELPTIVASLSNYEGLDRPNRSFMYDTIVWINSMWRNLYTFIPTNVVCPLILSIVFCFAFSKVNRTVLDIGPAIDLVDPVWVDEFSNSIQSFILDHEEEIHSDENHNLWSEFIIKGNVGTRTSFKEMAIFPPRDEVYVEYSDVYDWSRLISFLDHTVLPGPCLANYYQFEERYTYQCDDCSDAWGFYPLGLNYLYATDEDALYPSERLLQDTLSLVLTLDTLYYGNLSDYGPLLFANSSVPQILYNQCKPSYGILYWPCIALKMDNVSGAVDPVLQCVLEKPLEPRAVTPPPLPTDLILPLPRDVELIMEDLQAFQWAGKLFRTAGSIFTLATMVFFTPCVIGFIAYFSMCFIYDVIPFINFIRFSRSRNTAHLIGVIFVSTFIIYSLLGFVYLLFVLIPMKPHLVVTIFAQTPSTAQWTWYVLMSWLLISVFLLVLIPYSMSCVLGSLAGIETDFSVALEIYLMPLLISVVMCGFFVRQYDLNAFLNVLANITMYRWPFYAFLKTSLPNGYMLGSIPSDLASAISGVPAFVTSPLIPAACMMGFVAVLMVLLFLTSTRRNARLKGFFEGQYN